MLFVYCNDIDGLLVAMGLPAYHPSQGWGQVQLTKYSSTPSTPNIYQVGHSMSDHPMLETVPPQILIKSYTFGLCD